jgi:hypothetical protein
MGINENTQEGINTSYLDMGQNNMGKLLNLVFRKIKLNIHCKYVPNPVKWLYSQHQSLLLIYLKLKIAGPY